MRQIPLSRGLFAIVDAKDYPHVSKYKWHVVDHQKKWYYAARYIYTGKKMTRVLMHRFIMGLKNNDKRSLDHKDHDGLNNTRENLRIADNHQNMANSIPRPTSFSKFKGVSWRATASPWLSRIRVNRKAIHLGSFNSEIDAAKAYDVAAKEYFGEYARLNFP